MSEDPERFLERLQRSSICSEEQLKEIQVELQGQTFTDMKDLAAFLVKQNRLTRYQAQALLQKRINGLVMGNYIILDKLGQGGMGLVFQAMHRRMERIVALKLLSPALSRDAEAVKRFQREVKAAAQLSHPNIVTAYDADEFNGQHFLVMEYVEGKNLGELVVRNGVFRPQQAAEYIRQAAEGLAYAHERGIIHRDIKPGNLLLSASGVVKVLDMGLARFEDSVQKNNVDGLTTTGQVMGTVDFMPPEQAVSTRSADARSDIYSLGCTLFAMLIGEIPFHGETVMARMLAHREEPIPNMNRINPEIPESLNDIFRKMLAKQPEHRFQSMRDVEQALAGFLAGTPVETDLDEFDLGPVQLTEDLTLSDFPEEPYLPLPVSATRETRARSVLPARPRRKRKVQRLLGKIAKLPRLPWLAGAAGGLLLLLLIGAGWYFWPDGTSASDQNLQTGNQTPVNPRNPGQFLPPVQPGNPAAPQVADGDNYELRFDGRSGYVQVPGLSANNNDPHTLEAWFTIDRLRLANPLSLNGPNWATIYVVPQGWGAAKLNEGAGMLRGTGNTGPVSRRTHVAAVWTGDALRIYINGVSQPTSENPYPLRPTGSGLFIGGTPPSDLPPGENDRWFSGAIDEVRISRGERYDADFTPQTRLEPDGNTIALFHLDEVERGFVYDTSRRYKGKLFGDVKLQPVPAGE